MIVLTESWVQDQYKNLKDFTFYIFPSVKPMVFAQRLIMQKM